MFDSAWAPPIGTYEYAETLGYTIDASFCEFGEQFCGTYTTEDGYHEYKWDDFEDAKENVPDDLLEQYDFEMVYEDGECDEDD
jgi:hypothetical protein